MEKQGDKLVFSLLYPVDEYILTCVRRGLMLQVLKGQITDEQQELKTRLNEVRDKKSPIPFVLSVEEAKIAAEAIRTDVDTEGRFGGALFSVGAIYGQRALPDIESFAAD
jgi:hypothetical protein